MKLEDSLIVKVIMFAAGGLMALMVFIIGFPMLRAGTTQANAELPAYTAANMTTWKGLTATVTFFPLFSWLLMIGLVGVGGFLLIFWHVKRNR